VTEDKPQLARFLFLRQAWKQVIAEEDRSWIAQLAPKPTDEVCDIHWALSQVDDDSAVIDRLAGLQESVLDAEPSGREMRPR